jgi:hypothetical protein
MLMIAADNSHCAIHHLQTAVLPFFWELAQHTLKITNSAGRTFSYIALQNIFGYQPLKM